MNNLSIIADPKIRENLLLAEAVAWLHDMGKCDERLLQQSALDYDESNPANKSIEEYKYKEAHSERVGKRYLELPGLGDPVPLKQLIEESLPRYVAPKRKKPWLVRTLAFCHGVGHTEKEEAYYLLKQTMTDTRRSSPFGYESEPLVDLEVRLDKLPELLSSRSIPFDRSKFKADVEKAFDYAVGDTRRPINEVTLWDWSKFVAALYKGALAGALLGSNEDPPKMHWRLLSIRLNGEAFSEGVARIPDLLARQKLITNGLNNVRKLLEETYPLGTEVYRDEDGSVFIVPNIQNLLTLENDQGENLYKLIVHKFSAGTIKNQTLELDGEILPSLRLDEGEPWTRPPNISRYKHQDPLPINKHLKERPSSHADPDSVSRWWQDHSEDICTVCQLRPQGWKAPDSPDYKLHYEHRAKGEQYSEGCQICKALTRKICTICEERREDRSQQWAKDELHTTVWTDEISDVNGRIALVVGKFDLEHWLDGQMLFYPDFQRNLFIESLNTNIVVQNVEKLWDGGYQIAPDWDKIPPGIANGDNCFIREQRFQIVNVEKKGWRIETASEGAIKLVEEQIIHPGRLVGEQQFQPLETVETQTPARLHRVWETTQQFWKETERDFKTSVGEVSPRLRIRATFEPRGNADKSLGDFHTYELNLSTVNLSVVYVGGREFLTADNLERVAVLLNPLEKPPSYAEAVNRIFNRLLEENNKPDGIQIEQPTGYGGANDPLGRLRIMGKPTLEEMLEKTPYIPAIAIMTEMAEPRTFMAIVPADKALEVAHCIKRKYEREMGKVSNRLPLILGAVFAGRRTPLPAILDAGRRMLKESTQSESKSWKIRKVEPPLPRSSWPQEVELTLVKTVSSEGKPEDSDTGQGDRNVFAVKDWQTLHIKLQTVMRDMKTRDEWFPYWYMKSPVPDKWVHVCDLHEGDVVEFMPSRFDFEFLETAAQRFEISYEGDERRSSVHPCRPYYLEELEDFEWLWEVLSGPKGLTTTQIHNLIELIEDTRMVWAAQQDNNVFGQLVRDALDNARWNTHPRKYLEVDKYDQLCQSAVNGRLADVIELYMRILKRKPTLDQDGGNK